MKIDRIFLAASKKIVSFPLPCLLIVISKLSIAAPNFVLINTIPTIDDSSTSRPIFNIAITPNGRLLYGMSERITTNGDNENLLLKLDTSTELFETISLGLGGSAGGIIDITPDGFYVYAPIRAILNTSTPTGTTPRVQIVDTTTNTSSQFINLTGNSPFGPAL